MISSGDHFPPLSSLRGNESTRPSTTVSASLGSENSNRGGLRVAAPEFQLPLLTNQMRGCGPTTVPSQLPIIPQQPNVTNIPLSQYSSMPSGGVHIIPVPTMSVPAYPPGSQGGNHQAAYWVHGHSLGRAEGGAGPTVQNVVPGSVSGWSSSQPTFLNSHPYHNGVSMNY